MTTRDQIVAEARSWLGTPFHHCADIKGAGVDCAMLLVRVYCDLGVAPLFDPRPYKPQWFQHSSEARYLGWLQKYAREVTAEQVGPGDIELFNFGKHAAHGGIWVDAHTLIHAYLPACKVIAINPAELAGKHHSYWSPFEVTA